MTSTKSDLLLLFDRPTELSFMKKGEDFDTTFELPNNFLTERYQSMAPQLSSRFGEDSRRKIRVKKVTPPNLKDVMALGRKQQFSLWLPRHQKMAGRLIDIFMGLRSTDDLLAVAVYARDRVNPYLFQYALATAILHRPDTKDLSPPTIAETFPEKFIDSSVFRNVREETSVLSQNNRSPIKIPRDYTASDLDPEHRLWYFREDIGVNLHHWHWHLVYPFEASNRAIVEKDRRGELFFYMHQQIVARYNIERLCNDLFRVERYEDFRQPMKEGYFPKMNSVVSSRSYASRPDNTPLRNIRREADQMYADVADMERWRDRFIEAINQRYVVSESGTRIPLESDGSTDSGIDILGDMLESSILSPNRQLYGQLHNFGHVFISYAHDPDHKHLEDFGLINDPAMAMRDPMFYRFHAFVDDLFQKYKLQLMPYTQDQLTYSGVVVQRIQVQTQGAVANTFQTFFEESDMNVARGLDYQPHGEMLLRFTHLQHRPYNFSIQVNNTSGVTRTGMVRIFMAPRFDERGQEMLFITQRQLMIEMDKFVAQLNPGVTVLEHTSDESTVTIPYERTFRALNQETPTAGTDAVAAFNFCGCGWPDHLLVPRGTTRGYECDLFVMISDYEQDKVDQDLVGICNDAAAYCGVRDRMYPDRRPMGYPFDRKPRDRVNSLNDFLTPNMATQRVKILHQDITRARPRALEEAVSFKPLIPTSEESGTIVDYET